MASKIRESLIQQREHEFNEQCSRNETATCSSL